MTETLNKEIEDLIIKLNLNCTVDEFEHKVDWDYISEYCKLSEDFIKKFLNKVDLYEISDNQKLSESFIDKFHKYLFWSIISRTQKFSEEFIEKHENRVDWFNISYFQKLSLSFIEKYKDKLDVDIQMKNHHIKIDQVKEATEYAQRYNLKIEDEYLYAFRNHDLFGRGMWNKTLVYKPGETYTDWHCNFDKNNICSFGFGISINGNTPVKVKLEDFGVYLSNGNARVWKFTVL